MENRENQNPSTGSESDISKSQSQQQPPSQAGQQSPQGEGQFDPANNDQSDDASTGRAGFGETATDQRSDVEGSSLGKQDPTQRQQGGFVGSEGTTDTSNELIEDEDQQFRKDGQGAPEGK